MTVSDQCSEENETGPGVESGWDGGGFIIQDSRKELSKPTCWEGASHVTAGVRNEPGLSEAKKNAWRGFIESVFSRRATQTCVVSAEGLRV